MPTPAAKPTPDHTAQCCLSALLRMSGLRPTWQRLALGELLFSNGHRHVSAETLHTEIGRIRPMSLATVYNILRQFADAGLIRRLPVAAMQAIYNTDTSNHCHVFDPASGRVADASADDLGALALPTGFARQAPGRVDVVITMRQSTAPNVG